MSSQSSGARSAQHTIWCRSGRKLPSAPSPAATARTSWLTGSFPGGQVAEVAALEQVDHLGQLSVHVDDQAFPMAGTRAVDRISVAPLGVWNEVARNGPPDA